MNDSPRIRLPRASVTVAGFREFRIRIEPAAMVPLAGDDEIPSTARLGSGRAQRLPASEEG